MFKILDISRTITQTSTLDAVTLVSSTKVAVPWPTIIGAILVGPTFVNLVRLVSSPASIAASVSASKPDDKDI